MFAYANRNLIRRPLFSTLVYDKKFVMIAAQRPPLSIKDFEPEAFGAALLFAVQSFVDARAIEVDGTRDPEKVAQAISTGMVRILTAQGQFIRPALFQEG